MSTYRSVSFCGDLPPLAAIAFSYTVQFGQERKAGKVLVVERHSAAIWRDLHECAIAKEWDRAIEEVLPEDHQQDMKDALRTWGAEGFLSTADDFSDNEEFAPLLTRLRDRALPILERRTVFFLPEQFSESTLDVKDIVDSWAQQLYDLLSRGYIPPFSFVRVGQARKEAGMLDRIIAHVHSEIAASAFGREKDDRTGPTLLVGPTGTGKTYGARLYAKKNWGLDNFIELNLAAVTETTLESRIRGYVRGAFTGADANGRASVFEEADGGVLFLDEFQSVSKAYQTQFLDLLNAVNDKVAIARMGKDEAREVFHVKVVLAVNEDLGELLRTNQLRHDLFYRIRRIIRFKTLQERLSNPNTNRADLMMLLTTYRWRSAPTIQPTARGRAVDSTLDDELPASRLHAMFVSFEDAAIEAMLRHEWPGNLRELERVASDLFYGADRRRESTIRYQHVMQAIQEFVIPLSGQVAAHAPLPALVSTVPESTRVILASVERALREQRFNIGAARRELKVYKLGAPLTLRRFLVKHRDLLSPDIAAESKIQKFMEGQI